MTDPDNNDGTILRTLTAGTYEVRLACPDCDGMVSIPAEVGPSLTVEPDGRYLRVKVSTKRVEHRCNAGADEPLPFDQPGAD